MEDGTVKTVGVVLVVAGALTAMTGAFVPDIELGGSTSGSSGSQSGTAEGGISIGFGGLLWAGVLVMAVGLVLAVAPMFADRGQPPREAED